jgi:hypothetical protein
LTVGGTGKIAGNSGFFQSGIYNEIQRLQFDRSRVTSTTQVAFHSGYPMTDLNATHRLSSSVESVLQIQNLMNHYTNDQREDFAVMGRQTRLGIRMRM